MKKSAIILILCLALILTVAGCEAKESNSQTDLQMGVTALTALADNHIFEYCDLLKGLAARPEVQAGDWEQIKDLVAQAGQTRIAAKVWFVLPDGTAYYPEQGKASQDLSDRDYFPKLMAGNTVVGTLLVGKVSGKKSFLVAVPVKKDGKVVGGLGTTPYLDEFSQTLIQEIGLPADRIFYALDCNGAVALSSDTSQIMAQHPNLTQNVVWQTSHLTTWRFALGYTAGQ